jgi:hypothetical protein
MQRQVMVNGLLLALVLTLGGMAWLSIQQPDSGQPTPLTGLQPEQIKHLTLEHRDGPGIRLERRAGGWEMLGPYQARGNGDRIRRLLEMVRSNSFSRFPAPADVAEYGLSPPLAIITLDQTRIEVGTTHPMNQHRYLRIGDQVHLIKDRFIHHLQARAEGFVSPELLPPGSQISAIRTPDWQLTFATDGTATLNPPNPALSPDDLNRKRDQWRLARATRLVAAADSTGNNMIGIQLRDRQQSIGFELEQTGQDTRLIRRDLGLAYIIHKDSALLKPPGNEK